MEQSVMPQLPQQTILLNNKEIEDRVNELALKINQDFAGEEIVIIGVLTGSFVFLADLIRKIDVPLKVGFISLSSYQGETTVQTEVKEYKLPLPPIEEQNIILVEDIFDTGNSLKYAYELCLKHKPKTLKTCVLLIKEGHQSPTQHIDYQGFVIPDVFVVGYGLDYRDHYRQLPHVVQLKFDDLNT